MEVSTRKNRRKEKTITETKKLERPRRARPEVVLIKPAEAVSYAEFLKNLSEHVKPVKMGVIILGVRERRSKDLLVELQCSKESRGRLHPVLEGIIIATRSVLHLIPKIEIEITDIDPNTEADDVEGTSSGFIDHGSEVKLKCL